MSTSSSYLFSKHEKTWHIWHVIIVKTVDYKSQFDIFNVRSRFSKLPTELGASPGAQKHKLH